MMETGERVRESLEKVITYHRLVELAVEADLNDINALVPFLTKNPSLLLRTQVEYTLQNSVVFVARCELGRIIGMITVTPLVTMGGIEGFVSNFVVHGDFQGRRIGQELFRLAEEATRLHKFFLTSNGSREAARHIYGKFGYEEKDTGVFVKHLCAEPTN